MRLALRIKLIDDIAGGRGCGHGKEDRQGEEDRDASPTQLRIPRPFEEIASPFGHDFEVVAVWYKMTGVMPFGYN